MWARIAEEAASIVLPEEPIDEKNVRIAQKRISELYPL